MNYYISANNEYVKTILDKKRNELIKAVKEACRLVFTKGKLSKYEIGIFMMNGEFAADIKDSHTREDIYSTDFISIQTRAFTLDIDAVIADYDNKINNIKEFTAKVKKLK